MTKYILSEGSSDLFGLSDITDVVAFHLRFDDLTQEQTIFFGDYTIADRLSMKQAMFVMENLAAFLAIGDEHVSWVSGDLLFMDVLVENAKDVHP